VPRTLRTIVRMWQRIHMPTPAQVEAAARVRSAVAAAPVEVTPSTPEVAPARE
jgi:hypothetical protein